MELQDLIGKAQQGEQAAFATICERFSGLVKKQAFQPHLRPLAEEAQAQGWLAIAEGVKTYDPASGVPVAGYLESKVKYALWNLFKKERRRWQTEVAFEQGGDEKDDAGGLLAVLAAADNVEELLEQQEIRSELSQALTDLPERQRLAIVYTVLQGMSLNQAAQQLGVSLQAVHSLRQRGFSRLKKMLAS